MVPYSAEHLPAEDFKNGGAKPPPHISSDYAKLHRFQLVLWFDRATAD